jgi:hypothetical protein
MKWLWTPVLLLCACALGAELVRLAWDQNPEDSVVGYRVYAGTNSRGYFIVSNVVGRVNTTGEIVVPFPAVWHFAVTATNWAGLESAYSEEVLYRMALPAPQVVADAYVQLTPQAERSTNLLAWEPLTLEPTLVAATNAQEFFRLTGLGIESVKVLK